MRKHYIDNLRWLAVLLLIPYHAAMAWNVWDEPNYIYFHGSKAISSLIVFFSPYYMPLLFLLAGISTKYALRKRTFGQYTAERAKRLLIPLVSGTLLFMPVMTYIADRYNYGSSASFSAHYSVFFTKFTDLTGADGGFSVGQFWFLLYLFVISVTAAGITVFLKKRFSKPVPEPPFLLVMLLGLPLPLLNKVLSTGGKSLAEYLYIFLIGCCVFSNDSIIEKTAKYRHILLAVGLYASILNVWLFIWSETRHPALNTAAKFTAEWFMLPALMGIGKSRLDFTGRTSHHMSDISFPFFSFHFVWLVLFQYILSDSPGMSTAALYIIPAAAAYAVTFICCEITLRVPLLCFLTGTKTGKVTDKKT
ncbi:MAG: acyltransferase [Ruminococcus sp.]|nr:acyltransferase [Ruminococcus sp.]